VNTKKILIIFVVLVIAVAVFLLFFKVRDTKNKVQPLPLQTPSVTERVQEKFKGLTIPDDSTKIELKNISNIEGAGIATQTEVLADLPELEKGETYQVLLSNGVKTVLLGNLKQAKGGWILEYDLSKYVGYKELIVSKGSTEILKGSF